MIRVIVRKLRDAYVTRSVIPDCSGTMTQREFLERFSVKMIKRSLFRLVPPAGHPIASGHLFRAAIDSTIEDGRGFADMLKTYLGVKSCFLVSSGTAALHLILKAIARGTDRDEVIIPAYCCPSLVASAVRAGLKVKLCDICRDGFGMDREALCELLNPKTLCVVAVHLFGASDDVESIKALATQRGSVVVEDSAQAFGVESDGVKLGSRGDIGFYSFGRGKPFSMLGGAAIVTNRADFAQRIEQCLAELPGKSFTASVSSFAELLLYSLFVRPRLYWIPNSLPFLELGETKYLDDFGLGRMCRYHAALGKKLLPLNGPMNEERIEKSLLLIEGLSRVAGTSALFIPQINPPIPYLRLPVIFSSPGLREEVLSKLIRRGIGATAMYQLSLPKIAGVLPHLSDVKEYPNAEYIAARLLTLPVSSLVTRKDMNTMVRVFEETLALKRDV